MNKEFHYNITGIIAKRGGFSDEYAVTIVHASQLVDDNDSLQTIHHGDSDDTYEVYISQTIDILKPKRELMRIYPVFHFVPGQAAAPSAMRSDGKMQILTTTPGSHRAYKIMMSYSNCLNMIQNLVKQRRQDDGKGLPDDLMLALTVFEDEYEWKGDWQSSDWYMFQEAVKAHQAFCMDELAPLFEQMNVNLSEY